jgi:hypothetical protein
MNQELQKTYEYKLVDLNGMHWKSELAENGANGYHVVAATDRYLIMEIDRLHLKESS